MASRRASPRRAERLLAEHADGMLARLESESVIEDAAALAVRLGLDGQWA